MGTLNRLGALALILSTSAAAQSRAVNPPTVEDFASRPEVEDVSISPDGRYLALITTHNGIGTAVVVDRQGGVNPRQQPVLSEPEHFRMTWCDWATQSRLLCGFRGMAGQGGFVFGITRLVAVDADGRNMHVLVQDSVDAQGQYQDRIINWNPGPADTVLIEADEGLSRTQQLPGTTVYGNVGTHALPAVFELNVVTGRLSIRQHARTSIRHWITDKRGAVRLGFGFSGTTISYYARLESDRDWRQLTKFEIFSRELHFTPIAISSEDPNKAYAFAPSQGRRALWLIDLTDRDDPHLVFAHPLVDVSQAVLAHDGRLLGVRYETAYPMMYFADDNLRLVMGELQKLLPDAFSMVHGTSRDGKILVIRSVSDVDAPHFMVVDTTTSKALKVGSTFAGRDPEALVPMRPINYPARDGTQIPGYLSTPRAAAASPLPLIVLPHGGPIARDTWGYDFLRQFLVSRGYAVLQMNFRGSSGYGDAWFFAAHQDWGGLTYDDVVDGARWAIAQGIADPRRVCIVGWSFGGYLALVGAQRNPDLFRCAVDIAGVSDLGLLIEEGHHWVSAESIKKQIGTDPEKLKLNSPRLHAADFSVPLLMLHGRRDAQVPFAQSEAMDAALTRARKPHRLIVAANADHAFSEEKDRAALLHEIESFLGEQLPTSTAP
jgi:dipeptidyl aminopeptidase/acylaminoacyl peptidase